MNENENSCGSTDLAEQHYANDHKRRTRNRQWKNEDISDKNPLHTVRIVTQDITENDD